MDRREFLAGSALLAACAESRAAPTGAAGLPAIGASLGPASSEFWRRWGDGKAELASYRARSVRYGAPRDAEIVLITVTEPHDPSTRIKDDAAKAPVQILKLNYSEKFITGIYPYSVMSSVFCPVDRYAGERFSPYKITLSVQEWCGHVFAGLWPSAGGARLRGLSYFASEGDVDGALAVPDGALYEDALFLQLRELDGPFAGGKSWAGPLVPSLWGQRKAHAALAVLDAKLTRSDEQDRTRFTLEAGGARRVYEVERGGARRLLSWESSDGSRAELVASERLAYWSMNGPGGELEREKLGLDPAGRIPGPG